LNAKKLTELFHADVVAITFRQQKNREKMATLPMHCMAVAILCPVKAWAAVVSSILMSGLGSEKSHAYSAWEGTSFAPVSQIHRSWQARHPKL